MSFIILLLILIAVGAAVTYIPMDRRIRTAIVVVAIIVAILWVLRYAGLI